MKWCKAFQGILEAHRDEQFTETSRFQAGTMYRKQHGKKRVESHSRDSCVKPIETQIKSVDSHIVRPLHLVEVNCLEQQGENNESRNRMKEKESKNRRDENGGCVAHLWGTNTLDPFSTFSLLRIDLLRGGLLEHFEALTLEHGTLSTSKDPKTNSKDRASKPVVSSNGLHPSGDGLQPTSFLLLSSERRQKSGSHWKHVEGLKQSPQVVESRNHYVKFSQNEWIFAKGSE